MSLNSQEITSWFERLQDSICLSLEKLDGKAVFREDKWQRDGGGGGRTRILRGGSVIEKGGVNFSAVYGLAPEFLVKQLQLSNIESPEFFATGVSIVIHPNSPMVPIIHMNVRYFETSGNIAWFGGGIDLTPHYIIPENAKLFHQHLKNTCDKHDPSYYPEFKKWADNYFFIPHRNETRGIGGIFFDKLEADENHTPEMRWEFVKDVGLAFSSIYSEQVQRSINLPFSSREKDWQNLRRGRYVEFNLVYDRGTKFGLETNGRAESILMSLPSNAAWEYDFKPEKNSSEEFTLSMLRKDINWLEDNS